MLEIREPASFGVVDVLRFEPGAGEAATTALCAALARHAVLRLRIYRPLEEEEFRSLAELFGPVKDPVARAKDGAPFRYDQPRQIIDSGFVLTDEIRAKLGDLSFGGLDDRRPGLFETYHCDDTYTTIGDVTAIEDHIALPVGDRGLLQEHLKPRHSDP